MENRKLLIWGCVLILSIWECFARKNHDFPTDNPLTRSLSAQQLSDEQADDYYNDSQEQIDNCTRLPPNTKRSDVSYEYSLSFKSLTDGEFDNTVNSSTRYKDLILVMGNTGVGKTVLTQIIAGDLTRVNAVKTYTGSLVIVDDFERISAPSVVSRTLIPELVVKNDNGTTVAFYDCPGFDDTRGPVQDVAASFFMNQIVNKVTRVKILFLVLYSSVTLGHDRVDFDLMVEHATTYVKNMTKFKKSIGLVATKAENYSKYIRGNYMKDGSIKRKIVEFLQKYNETMHDLLRENFNVNGTGTSEKIDEIKKKIEFVNILLEKDTSNKYTRITFSRDPEKCGPLSESTEVANTKRRVEHLYNSLSFSNVGSPNDNFGYSLKPETILEIKGNYAPALNNGIISKLDMLVRNFTGWFDVEKEKEVTNCSLALDDNLVRLLDHSSITIDNLLTKDYNNFSMNAVTFSRVLKSGLNRVGFRVPDSFVEFMKRQDDMFDFLQTAVGPDSNTNLRRINEWINPLTSLRETVMSNYVPYINDKIVGKVEKLVDDFKNWLDIVKFDGIENYPTLMATILNDASRPNLFSFMHNNCTSSLTKLSRALRTGFIQVGYCVPVMLVKFMERQDEIFQFFQNIVGLKTNLYKEDDWIYPISALRTNITKNYVPATNEITTGKIAELVLNFENWFDTAKIQNIAIYSTSMAANLNEMVEETSIAIGNIILNSRLNYNTNIAVTLSKAIQTGFNQVGFDIPESFHEFMEIQNVLFHIFQKIVGREHALTKINDWISPLFSLQAKMVEYKSWYGFCTNVQSVLSSHSFHEGKSNQIWNSLQTNLQFIEENQIVSVSQNIKYLSNRYSSSSKQMQLLRQMVTYANAAISISCSGKTITVKGHFIRFGAFLDGNGNVRTNISSCLRRNLENYALEIYASNTIFIDESLNGVGLDLKVVLVSPKFKVIGRPHINLAGKKGLDIYPTKAGNGVNAGDTGQSGMAGMPGYYGGVFVGIAGKIEDGNRLKVTLNGGDGGAGQDGGDGEKGEDGKHPINGDTWFDGEVIRIVWNEHWRKFDGHPGSAGGDGGDGGVGGMGGLPGEIYLKSLSDESYLGVQVSQNSGNTGQFGKGGMGGEGGKPGKALKCHAANILGIPVEKFKCRPIDSPLAKAANGNNGKDNYSELELTKPVITAHEISKDDCVYKFKTLFSTILDIDCKVFTESLNANDG